MCHTMPVSFGEHQVTPSNPELFPYRGCASCGCPIDAKAVEEAYDGPPTL